jgi:hypothetical protein
MSWSEPDFTHYLCEQRKEMEIYERSRQRNHSHNGPPHQIHTYADLRQQIHDDLRLQHPEWIQPNGESPICDSYEARLIKLLARD